MPVLAAFVTATVGPAVLAQTAYFSVTGNLSAADVDQSFSFDFTRDLGPADDPRFATFHHSGGTNAAGQVIPAGSFDPLLDLDDTFSGITNFTNDDGGAGFDSLIAYSGSDNGTDLQATDQIVGGQPVVLTLRKFDAAASGDYAVDVTVPAGPSKLVDLRLGFGNTGSLDSLLFGTTGSGTDPALFEYTNSSFDGGLDGDLIVAHTGNAVFRQTASSSYTVGGLTQVNGGGSASLSNSATFNAQGNLRLVGGGAFTVGSDATLNVTGFSPSTTGTGSLDGGIFTSFGTVNLSQNGVLNLDGEALDPSASGTGGAGGRLDILDGTVMLTANAKITARGGAAGDGNPGNDGGTLNVTSAAVSLANSAEILLSGSRGGNEGMFDNGDGGAGGDITFTNGSLSISNSAKLVATGGLGANQFNVGDGANGGDGGTLMLNNSSLTLGGTGPQLNLNAGNGFTLFGSVFDGQVGNGGDGGDIVLTNGSTVLLNGGEISQQGGSPGALGGVAGVTGTLSINDGTVTLLRGTLRGTADASPGDTVNLIGADVDIADAGTLEINNTATVSGGTLDVTAGGLIEATRNLTVQNSAQLNIDNTDNLEMATGTELIIRDGGQLNVDDFYVVNGHTLRIENGGTVTLGDNLDIGYLGPAGTLIVDNATLNTNTALSGFTFMDWGQSGAADVDIINGSMVTIESPRLEIADAGGTANVAINSGSTVVTLDLKIGDGGGTNQISVLLDGAGTTLTQFGASNFEIGGGIAATTGNVPRGGPSVEAEMGIRTGAVYTAGGGPMTIGDAGRIFVLGEGSLLRANTINVSDLGGNDRLNVSNNATLQATTVNGPLSVDGGILSPYGGIGQMQEIGTMTLNGAASFIEPNLKIDIAGLTAHDRIIGSAVIDENGMAPGDLDIQLLGGYRPEQGAEFVIIDVASFQNGTGLYGLPAEEVWGVSWIQSFFESAGTFTLMAAGVCPDGDFNCDGVVNLLDLDILGSNWNGTDKIWGQGDANGDGVVGLLDLDILGSNWNFGTSEDAGSFAAALAASGISVPEPSAAVLIVGSALTIAGRRRRIAA